ncbi:MAG TPA: hypothetical protein VI911_00195 [Patescibacteria group bacterium]|nr:hypothetical protein [Patescibacteria group bacterium]
MKTQLFNFAFNQLFNLYLWLSKFGYYLSNKNRVYDSLGLIDTLGSDSDDTLYTKSYSEELGSMFIIKLPFGYLLRLIEGFDKSIDIIKQ